MAIDLESINRRVGVLTGQSPSEPELDYKKVRADFSAFAASKAGTVTAPQVEEDSGILDEVKAIGSDIARGAINNVAASSLEAFGQFDKADELRQYSEAQFARTGQAPVFGELPGGRFIKESIFENAPQLAVSAALLAIPVAGPALAVASIFLPLYGESRREVLDGTGKDQALAALTPAVFNTAIELNPVGKIANRFGLKNPFANAMKQQILADKKSGLLDRVKDIGAFSSEIAIKEGLIEVAQNASNLATVRFLTDEAVLSKLTPEQKNEMWAGFWGGLSAGGAIGAVSAGYSQYRGDVYLKDRQKEAESDERILNAIQSRKAGNEKPAPISQEAAAKQVIASALPVTAPTATATGTNIPEATIEVPPAPPVTSLQDLLTEQESQLVDQILTMPEHDQAIAIKSAETRLAEVKQEIAFLENRFQTGLDVTDTTIDDYQNLDNHTDGTPRLTADARPLLTQSGDLGKMVNKLEVSYGEKDGKVVKSSLPIRDNDIDVNSGLVIAAKKGIELTAEQVQTIKSSWEVLGKLGLQQNPKTGIPFRFIVVPNTTPNGAAVVVDSSTLLLSLGMGDIDGQTDYASLLYHELSHLVTRIVQQSMTPAERTKLYKAWLEALSTSVTKGDYYRDHVQSFTAIRQGLYERTPTPDKVGYAESLSEFLAESFRNSFLNLAEKGEFDLKTELPLAFKSLNKSYRQIQSIAKKEGVAIGDGPFKDFIKLRLLRQELVRLEAANEARERDAKQAEKLEVVATTPEVLPESNLEKNVKDIEVSQAKEYKKPKKGEKPVVDVRDRKAYTEEVDKLPAKVSSGPMVLTTTPLKGTLYRETNLRSLQDLLMNLVHHGNSDKGSLENLYVTDDKTLAIGQGDNKGASFELNGTLVSGKENKKPGAGIVGGKEFLTNFLHKNSITKFTVPAGTKFNIHLQNTLDRKYSKVSDGNVDVYLLELTNNVPEPAPAYPYEVKTVMFFDADYLIDKMTRYVDKNGIKSFKPPKDMVPWIQSFYPNITREEAQDADWQVSVRLSDHRKKQTQKVEMKALKKDGPQNDIDHLILSLDQAGFAEQAVNLKEVAEINMGFLGNNLRGAAARKMLTPLQIAEQAEARGFSQPTAYMELVQQFQATKMRIIERADTALREWRSLGTKEANNVSRMLYLVSTKSDELGRRLTPEELAQIQAGVGLSAEGLAEWNKIDKLFLQTVSDIEAGMVYDAAKTYIEDRASAKEFRDKYMVASKDEREALIEQYTGKPLLDLTSGDALTNPLWDVLESIKGQTDGMRNKNYFPRARLGEYAVRIYSTEEGVEWEGATSTKENETLGFYAFDTEAEQKAFVAEMASSMGNGLRSYAYKMDSEVFAVMGLPAGIIEQVKREIPNLTQRQREQLDDIAMQRSPGRRFLRHLTKRRGIAGYSEDAMRVFANYLTSSANHLARTEHASDLARSIADMEATIKATPGDSVVVNDLNVLKDYFVKHFDYLMKPDNDWARLRAVGFLWYLGFNVKSAAVNFMQTPMVTYPVLAKHTSDGNAVRRIAGAMKDATAIMTGRATLTEGEAAAIQELIEAGLIDESMVSELAGMAEGNALQRLVPGMNLKSALDKFAWAGGWGFRIGEKYNRYVAALAAYRVAKDNKLSQEDAVKFARDAVQSSQFEYSRWNRAEFMRGKKSVLFLFWQYMQHASYLAFGGKGSATATRMWMLALLIAGIEGLPFAEMILNIFDFSGTQIKKMLGHPNPRVALREDLRELILNIHDRPDDILKGMSYQWGLGPLHAASLLGIPVPQVSTRGSLSYGNPVQWFDSAMDPTVTDSEKLLAQSIAAVAGPVGGIALAGVEAMTSKDPDAWKRWEKIMPVFMKSASQGVRWSVRGEETSSDQSALLTFETPEQRAEAVLKSLGFQPTRVDQTRQQLRATQVPVLYLQARQAALLKQLDYAVLTKNREGKKDALEAIKAYNDNLAKSKIYAPLMVKSSTISDSLRGRFQRRAEKEAGIQQGSNALLIQKANERLYPITSGE